MVRLVNTLWYMARTYQHSTGIISRQNIHDESSQLHMAVHPGLVHTELRNRLATEVHKLVELSVSAMPSDISEPLQLGCSS